MTFKKIMSLLLALSMVMGLMVTGVFTTNTEAAEEQTMHSPGTLVYANHNGKDFYLYADISDNGTDKRVVYASGSVSTTSSVCYSLNVAEFDGSNGIKVRLYMKAAYEAVSGVGCFWLKAGTASDGKATFIYSYDHTATPSWDTGTSKENANKWYHSFTWDPTAGQIRQQVPTDVEGEYAHYVLVCKQINDAWRMVFVSADDAAAAGSYPVKLGQLTACSFGPEYQKDAEGHWQECSCGAKSTMTEHTYEWKAEGDSHWQECVCGDKIVADTHTPATEWSKDADNHWHVCSCGYITDKSAHTYGDYVQDYVNGQQTKTCSGCGDQVTIPLTHDCSADETKWYVDGEYHYRKCSLCGEAMESTKAKHTYPETFEKDETQHWQVCSVCDELSTKADHDHKPQKNDDQHWTACACGDETTKENHNYTNWTVTTPATETTAGSRTGKCACGAEKTVPIPPVLKEGVYYLTGKVGGVDRYFVHGTVTNTSPYSQNSTTDKTAATTVNISYDEETLTYTLTYETNKTLYLYINDENPKGDVDTGVTGSEREDRTPFLWDAENKVLYQMEGDVKYVLAFKTMTNTKTNEEEVRIAAVPYAELSSSVVAIQLEIYHEHSFGESWKSDASSHWHECACGAKSGEAEHTVTNWTVEKEATETEAGKKTGKCDVCGYELISTIPATGAVDAPAPEDGDVNRLSVVINGVRYYYRHTETGESVTSTTPYSLYVTTDESKAIDITVKADGDGYILCYDRGDKNLRVYLNGNGVGITASEDPAMVRFYWDAQNKALYQMEGDVKYYLVFKTLNNELRITAVPETEALAGGNVYLMKLYGDTSANTGDGSMIGLMALLMVLSVCAMAGVVTARKKFF